MSEPIEDAVVPVEETEEPKKKRFRWYLQFPCWLFGFVMWFGFDTLRLRNVPLLLMLIFVFGVLYLIHKGIARRFEPPPKPRTWKMAKFVLLQMLATLAFLFGVLCVMRFCVPPVAISKRTLYLTSPLTDDGREIDTARAIDQRFAPKIEPHENGFRWIVRLFGPDRVFDFEPEHREDYTVRFLKRLELDGHDQPRLKLQDIHKFFEREIEKQNLSPEEKAEKSIELRSRELVNKMLRKPWKTADFPGSEDWLRDNAEALDRFAETVRMPNYYVPPLPLPHGDPMADSTCYEGNFHRSVVRSLQCRVMHSLAEGNVEKAMDDTESILRLSNSLILKPVSTTQYLISRAVQGVGFICVRRTLEFGEPTQEQLGRLRDIVRENQAVADPMDLVFLFRLNGINWLYSMATARFFEEDTVKEDRSAFEVRCQKFCAAAWYYFAWNSVFQRYQEFFDRLEPTAVRTPSGERFHAFIRQAETSERRILGDSFSLSRYLSLVFQRGVYQLVPDMIEEAMLWYATSSMTGVWRSQYRGFVQIRQMDLAIALERFRLDHGVYPKELTELKPGYLGEIPTDPFTEAEPFRYVTTETEDRITGYSLYSIGENGIDDGGFNRSEKSCDEKERPETELPERTGDDIRIFINRP